MLVRRIVAGALTCGCLLLAACQQEPRARTPLPPHDVAAPPSDALRTDSGLAFRVLAAGHGSRHPGAHARIELHYTGWMADGTLVDDAPPGSQPVAVDIEELMPGLQEGVRMMVDGEKRRFWIPPSLANEGRPGRAQGMLVYDVTLVRCVD
jgi:FKBP-type peptidyl-prolyl cis-trans isomerase